MPSAMTHWCDGHAASDGMSDESAGPAEDDGGLYTLLADRQLDDLYDDAPVDLYNAVVDCIDYILDEPAAAREKAPPLQDADGRALLSTVVMYEKDPRWFVFWRMRSEGPVIVGIGPLPAF